MNTNNKINTLGESDEFSKYICTFRKNESIMVEGEESDNSIHLLRQGSVGVYRKVAGEEVLIDCIDAVNFFGELEVINGGPRMGTVKALTDTISTYRFFRSDLQTIFLNPYWGELLIIRLSKDLMYFSDRFVKDEAGIYRLLNEKEGVLRNMTDLLLTINRVLNSVVDSRTLPIQNREDLLALIGMIQKYLALKIPEIGYHVENASTPNYRKMYEENLIPEKLAGILLKTS